MGSLPISVIVIAHDRKDYLLEALESVKNQTLDRKKYEIICVKNFMDEVLESQIKNSVDLLINSQEDRYGMKVFEAISASTGEILCFLDDDDAFSRNKLEIIYSQFTENERLEYFHNGRTTELNRLNSATPIKQNAEKTLALDLQTAAPQEIVSFFRKYPDFNSSSISVRLIALEGKLNSLKSMVMHPDTFFLFSALERDGIIVDDPAILTFYRMHQSTTNHFEQSLEDFFQSKSSYYTRTESDWAVLSSILEKDTDEFLCNCESVHNRLLKGIYEIGTKPSAFFALNIDFVKCIGSRKIRNMMILSLIGFTLSIFPKIGRKLFYIYSTRLVSHS